MKTARNNLPCWLGTLLALSVLAPSPARAQGRALLAHGSGPAGDGTSPIWVALVGMEEGESQGTSILLRETFGTRDWAELPRIPARVMDITGHGNELVVLLEPPSGYARRWAWFSKSRYTFGPELPAEAPEILAMAGSRRSLWALGRASQPATTSTAAPAPTEGRAGRINLYSLDGTRWIVHPTVWPDDVKLPERHSLSMVLLGEKPALAVAQGADSVQILELQGESWVSTGKISFPGGLSRHFKLLDLKGEPILWAEATGPGSGGGRLWRSGDLAELRLAGPSAAAGQSSLVVAGDDLRLFFIRDSKLLEQRYDLRGVPNDQPSEINPVRARGGAPMERHWVAVALMAVLLVLILNALLRQRRANRDEDNPDQE